MTIRAWFSLVWGVSKTSGTNVCQDPLRGYKSTDAEKVSNKARLVRRSKTCRRFSDTSVACGNPDEIPFLTLLEGLRLTESSFLLGPSI